ncbi:MAG: nucleotidyltransferase family protein [Gemmatimonadales bacterium]
MGRAPDQGVAGEDSPVGEAGSSIVPGARRGPGGSNAMPGRPSVSIRRVADRSRGPLRDRLRELRNEIRSAAHAHGASDVRLFGSVARGEEHPDSDVDFLVVLEPGRTLLDLARLEIRLEKLFGRRVDVMTASALQEPVRSAALRESLRV